MAWYGWALTALWSGEHLSWGSKSIDSSLNLFMAIESQSGCRTRESVFMAHIYRHLKGNLIDFFRCTDEDLLWQRNAETICKLHMTNSIEGNWMMYTYSCKMVRSLVWTREGSWLRRARSSVILWWICIYGIHFHSWDTLVSRIYLYALACLEYLCIYELHTEGTAVSGRDFVSLRCSYIICISKMVCYP